MRRIAITTIVLPPLLVGCAAGPPPEEAAPAGDAAPRVVRYDEGVRGIRSVVVDLDRPGHAAMFLISPGHRTTLLLPNHADTEDELGAGTQRISLPVDPSLAADSCRRVRTGRCVEAAPPRPRVDHWILLVRSARPLDLHAIAADIGGYPHRHSMRQTTRLQSGSIEELSRRILQRITVGEDWSGAVCRLERDSPYCVDALSIEPPLEPAP